MTTKLVLAIFLFAGTAVSTAPASAMRSLIHDRLFASHVSSGCGAQPTINDGCTARCDCTPPDADGNQECKWTVSCP
jgi:hypothetical protein